MPETLINELNYEAKPNKMETEALKKLTKTSRWNQICVISLFFSLIIVCLIALTMFAEIISKTVLLFEGDTVLFGFLQKDIFCGRCLVIVLIPSAIISVILILVYTFKLKRNEKAILEVMTNAKLSNWYKIKKVKNNSLYLFRHMYNQYNLGELKTELEPRQKKIFRELDNILYPDNNSLEDMDSFCYELYMGSFFDILIRLSIDSSDKAVNEIIKDYSKERNLENLKKRNKKSIKENNKLLNQKSWKFYYFMFKVGILFTMILWLGKSMFFPETEYGVFYSNYFNICAVFLLGTELWERKKDFLLFNNIDDYGTKKRS